MKIEIFRLSQNGSDASLVKTFGHDEEKSELIASLDEAHIPYAVDGTASQLAQELLALRDNAILGQAYLAARAQAPVLDLGNGFQATVRLSTNEWIRPALQLSLIRPDADEVNYILELNSKTVRKDVAAAMMAWRAVAGNDSAIDAWLNNKLLPALPSLRAAWDEGYAELLEACRVCRDQRNGAWAPNLNSETVEASLLQQFSITIWSLEVPSRLQPKLRAALKDVSVNLIKERLAALPLYCHFFNEHLGGRATEGDQYYRHGDPDTSAEALTKALTLFYGAPVTLCDYAAQKRLRENDERFAKMLMEKPFHNTGCAAQLIELIGEYSAELDQVADSSLQLELYHILRRASFRIPGLSEKLNDMVSAKLGAAGACS